MEVRSFLADEVPHLHLGLPARDVLQSVGSCLEYCALASHIHDEIVLALGDRSEPTSVDADRTAPICSDVDGLDDLGAREAEEQAVVLPRIAHVRREGPYQLVRTPETRVDNFADLRSLDSALATPFTVELLPPARAGRYYYLVSLDAESLPLSELDEIERWLRGDLGRALTQRGDVSNAFSRGARLVMIRLSGLPHRSLQARTEKFQP